MESILEIKNLSVSFKKKTSAIKVVKNIDLQVKDGEVLAIVGESGSGKSVTMKSVMNILPSYAQVEADELTLCGKKVLELNPKERRSMLGNEVAMVFQDPMTSLDPLKTVGYHLVESIKRHQKISKREAKKLAIEMLDKVGIPSPKERMKQFPHEFSGGMRQRVLIAMALCAHPNLLIADEPTTALDVTIQAQILRLLKQLHETENMNIIIITHDLGVVANIADRIAVMYQGKIVETGTRDEILFNPKHAYTKALLSARPDGKNRKERLKTITSCLEDFEGENDAIVEGV